MSTNALYAITIVSALAACACIAIFAPGWWRLLAVLPMSVNLKTSDDTTPAPQERR